MSAAGASRAGAGESRVEPAPELCSPDALDAASDGISRRLDRLGAASVEEAAQDLDEVKKYAV